MKILGVIPARYGSTRFEGKPLVKIEGHTMIEWVYRRALKCKLDKVVIATDDKRIFDKVVEFGGEVVMTKSDHETGTDRIAEVAGEYPDYDAIINIQGDEPLLEPEMIDTLAIALRENDQTDMATLKHIINNEADIENPNVVKVITDKNNDAIYFSRSVIPYNRKNTDIKYYRHVGLYGYKMDFLIEFSKMESTQYEKTESLEQLRVLENGYKIKVLETEFEVIGVDTPEDLHRVEKIIKEKNITLL